MAIYIVAMESADGQKSARICATGKTRRECIQKAVDEASARDGIVYTATATTNLKKVVDAPLLPPMPSPRKICVSPKPRPRSRAVTSLPEAEQQVQHIERPFDPVFEVLRKERNRCISQRDVEGARGFDQADAELRAAILDAEGGI
jgi:hypothetical protein